MALQDAGGRTGGRQHARGQAKMLLLDLQNSINMGKLKQPLPPHTLAHLPVPDR